MDAPHGPAAGEPQPPQPFRRALVIANPIAGRGRGARAGEELRAGLAGQGLATRLAHTAGAGDARRLASELEPSVDLVLVVGGDGTLGEVFSGLEHPAPAVGQLPMGTANVLAVDLGLPRDVAGLLGTVRAGHTRPIDVARVGGRTCFLMASAGFDALVVETLAARRRGPIAKFSYLAPTLSALARYRPPRLSVWLDGERVAGTFGFVLASNCVHYGGLVRLAPGRVLDDGLFEVFLFERASPLSLLAGMVRGHLRGLPGAGVSLRRAAHVRVESEEPCPYQVDGDPGGTTPLELAVDPHPHRLLVPCPR